MLSASNESRMKIKASWLGGTGESEMFCFMSQFLRWLTHPIWLQVWMDVPPIFLDFFSVSDVKQINWTRLNTFRLSHSVSNLTYKMFILGFEHGRKSAYLSLYYHEDTQLFYVSKTFVGLVSTSKSISLDEAMSSNLFSFAITHRKGNLYVSLRRFLVICYCFRGWLS